MIQKYQVFFYFLGKFLTFSTHNLGDMTVNLFVEHFKSRGFQFYAKMLVFLFHLRLANPTLETNSFISTE